MQPLIVLVTVFFLLILPLGWWTALRVALTATFLLTASAHWRRKRRDDLIRMLPAALPRPDLLITVTGICEIQGAVGLLVSRVAPVAALGLTPLLIALFPANVRATRQAIAIGGRPATPLPARAGRSSRSCSSPPQLPWSSAQRCDRWPPGFYLLDSMTKLKKTPIDP